MTTALEYFTVPVGLDGSRHWCSPADGAIFWCLQENWFGYEVFDWLCTIINFTTVIFLVSALLYTRLLKKKDISKMLYCKLAMFCGLANYFNGMYSFLRQVPGVPTPVIPLMYGFAGVFTISGVYYFLLSYQDLQENESLMMSPGLKKYRKRWIAVSIFAVLHFMITMPVGAMNDGEYYEIDRRVFWGLLFLETNLICVPGMIHGYRLIKMMKLSGISNSASVTRTKIFVLLLFGMYSVGCPLMGVATITPMLFDRIVWLWYIFYGTITTAICLFSNFLAVWMIKVAAHDESLSMVDSSETSIKLSYSGVSTKQTSTTPSLLD